MPTEHHTHLPERADVRMRVALAGLQLERLPRPRYKMFYRINMLNTGRTSVRLLGRKWLLKDAAGDTRIIEAARVFNNEPILTPGAVFSFSGYQYFDMPPVGMELRVFGQAHNGSPFITPRLEIPLSL